MLEGRFPQRVAEGAGLLELELLVTVDAGKEALLCRTVSRLS